jgi:MFS transporter
VVTAYTLSFGSLLPFGRRLADVFGRKRMFLTGLVGFAAASALGGAAPNIGVLITARAVQGGFAAVLAPAALSPIGVTFSDLKELNLYWFTNSAASSARICWENKSRTFTGPKLTLPVAVTVFPKDIPRLLRSWIEDTYSNLIHYGEAGKGGHK